MLFNGLESSFKIRTNTVIERNLRLRPVKGIDGDLGHILEYPYIKETSPTLTEYFTGIGMRRISASL